MGRNRHERLVSITIRRDRVRSNVRPMTLEVCRQANGRESGSILGSSVERNTVMNSLGLVVRHHRTDLGDGPRDSRPFHS